MKERIALLVALAEAIWARQTHEFEWLVKAAYGAGATSEDLLTAVENGRLLGDPPAPVVTAAYATVHAWQWMASSSTPHRHESPIFPERRHTERIEAWVPCTTK